VFRKDFEKAEEIFLEVLDTNPDEVQALSNMGRLCASQNLPDEAKKYFDRVLKLDPQNKTARDFLKKQQ
jgi:tetratricopeptide (TPR) repeat protein